MKKVFIVLLIIVHSTTFSQNKNDWQTIYRGFATKINDLVHTKLEASFDYQHSYLNGKEWVTLKPHFYPTDSLTLDAKGMNIDKVAIDKNGKLIPLQYRYDSMQLKIQLDRTYTQNEKYTIYIQYTAKPNEYKGEGSAAITDAKGLYFINPLGKDKNKPTQIWTQGETESNSVWIPTIDKPDQKCTDEFILTVPDKYVTLSNGKLIKQQKNNNNTRTDTWLMDLPHSPYLFFIGVGDYAIVKDSYRGKEVSYYVEKPYEKVARKIFGHTPEMIQFYSNILGIDFPWQKYAQIVGRDYVSGAMENTTAVLHQESAQQDARQLTDENIWEETIAHELFHHWFGDLVTCESWSNLTVNESFANYSEVLWDTYKYGKEAGDYQNWKDMNDYFLSNTDNKDLVRFYYQNREDMFDAVSYNKGGRILHMLKNYVGDSAFFHSLNLYLNNNKFGNGSAVKLRLAFEAVTGKDLNWFFNQWYFGSGHPVLDISYIYDEKAQLEKVIVQQKQISGKIFKLPFAIDIYTGENRQRYQVCAENRVDTFYFKVSEKPNLVNVDADKILLAQKTDHKTVSEFFYQYNHAQNFLDKREAVVYGSNHLDDVLGYTLVENALYDPFFRIRINALNIFNTTNQSLHQPTIDKIEKLAKADPKKLVRASAIDVLGKLKNKDYKNFFVDALQDSSYSVAGAALSALSKIDSVEAFKQALQLSKVTAKGHLLSAIVNTFIHYGDADNFDYVAYNFSQLPVGQEKFEILPDFTVFLSKISDSTQFRKGIDYIIQFKKDIPLAYHEQTDPFINLFLNELKSKKQSMGQLNLANYITEKLKEGNQ
ncbi:M1 family aminopeptidase [Hydrotalea sp.]|uniref:M1 family aminopeptidase n=1 Tax=Hydrotalea sp. TaxID=2881279 RepID=UPI00094569FD|nr:M1 family aminopeptidase [Hydrotalea sp.]